MALGLGSGRLCGERMSPGNGEGLAMVLSPDPHSLEGKGDGVSVTHEG